MKHKAMMGEMMGGMAVPVGGGKPGRKKAKKAAMKKGGKRRK